MLAHLKIQNFALIDSLSIDFDSGFTVLTGETGSGKSILLQALNLLLGERADFSVIGDLSDKSIVEAEFDLSNFSIGSFFQENELDNEPTTIVRREISKQGKSRAFINDTPVQLNVLKQFSEKIIHIHSQHHTLELKKSNFQIDVLDTLSNLSGKKLNYIGDFRRYQKLLIEERSVNEELTKSIQTLDYNQFQLTEIDELNLEKNNYDNLESELLLAEKSDEIKESLHLINLVIDQDGGVLVLLNKLKTNLDKLGIEDESIKILNERIKSAFIELKDISNEADELKDLFESNPFKISELTASLDKYNKILSKHNLKTKQELIEFKAALNLDIHAINELSDKLKTLKLEIEALKIQLESQADELHEIRLNESNSIEFSIKKILNELKMPDTQIEFSIVKNDILTVNGFSEVELKFSPNKGVGLVSVDKAASGGELSRLMLAIQKLISVKKQLPTLIFDEIDTGVSGDVAQKIGVLLKNMGENSQILAITHLPQVAAKASAHIKVEKNNEIDRAKTNVFHLKSDERIHEIARLMSGEKINNAALLNAKALMD